MTLNDLSRLLPPREDLMRLLAARPSSPRSSALLGMLGLGVVIGAVAAAFMTPQSGAELRKQLSARVDDARKQMRSAAQRAGAPTNGGRDHRDADYA